jgi:hypothetical protein
MLLDNAVDVKLVFESSLRDSHQDFADCGRSKPISKSTLSAYDARDQRNHIATVLSTTHPFLLEYVDGSANNVNLTANSHRIWSLAAIKTMVDHIIKNHPETDLADDVKVRDVGLFLDELVKVMPQLKILERCRAAKLADPAVASMTGKLREQGGGDVALRAIGVFMFARAFLHCVKDDVSYQTMAEALAHLDWHALDCARDEVPVSDDPDIYHETVMKHANPIWRPLIVVKPKRYKISSSTQDANNCWDRIINMMFPAKAAAA